jgi:hypothetical protein
LALDTTGAEELARPIMPKFLRFAKKTALHSPRERSDMPAFGRFN